MRSMSLTADANQSGQPVGVSYAQLILPMNQVGPTAISVRDRTDVLEVFNAGRHVHRLNVDEP